MEPSDPAEIKLVQVQVNIGSTGRPVMLAVPGDITDHELFEVISWMANPEEGLRASIRPKSPLVVARGLVGLPS